MRRSVSMQPVAVVAPTSAMQTVPTLVPPRSRSRSKSRSNRNSTLGKIQGAVQRVAANPIALLAIALCLVMASTDADNPVEDWIKKVGERMEGVEWLKTIGNYIKENAGKTLGAAVLATICMVMGSKNERVSYAIASVVAVVVMPVYSSWNYGWAAALLALGLQMRDMMDRLILSVIGVLAYVVMFVEEAPSQAD